MRSTRTLRRDPCLGKTCISCTVQHKKVPASGGPDEMKRLLGANDASRTQVTQRCQDQRSNQCSEGSMVTHKLDNQDLRGGGGASVGASGTLCFSNVPTGCGLVFFSKCCVR